ncbi:MAG: glycosyltransferase family 8 protein [Synergistaceae bacterium]|jgi:lipopolysaccharide biosynthesis glycosyltransferase|nr:glycosyltransferase family 8 protein [Synergistaceae bacterium]
MSETDNAADAIHVALAIYDPKGTYSRHSGVVMTSIFERTKSPVCVHILHDRTMTERNRALLKETAETFGQGIAFHDVSPHIEQVGNEAIRRAEKHQHSIGALFRLLIPELLPSKIEKVIYLDSDILVNMNIQELWDISLENYSLAGVLDHPINKPYRRFSYRTFGMKLMGCDRKHYINSGVLSMNLPKVRKKFKLSQQGVSWYKRYAHCSDLVDQDLINSCFRGDIKIIDSKFNNCYVHDGDISNSILHAIGIKPWNGLNGSDLERMYWKTYFKTPWGKLSPDAVADLMFDVMRNSPFTHRRTSQCYKKMFFRLRKDVFLEGYAAFLWLLLKDVCYRVRNSVRG